MSLFQFVTPFPIGWENSNSKEKVHLGTTINFGAHIS